ncbi:MAG: LLM class flavin-dependent oxidoreductase [bacterium]|nr:LLM class flavin-dependent oxidoreductase [bacterium]
MKARNKIKSLIAMKCTTLTRVAQQLSEKTGKNYTFKSLTGKLQRGSLSLDEAYLIADILGYKLEFIDKDEN